jgi:tripeptidyl-peptidase-1
MVSLINDKLLNAGKSPLGFLNPLLYQMAAAKPTAFNDITSGTEGELRQWEKIGIYL